ncbi:MAG: hypothetical protein IJ711_10925 [Lachnospiraceae bacterium]|nr:hypothetical protein [Lachnospiraceae bacterium]
MVFWCGSELKALDGNVITDCDLLILFTNATMALVQREKEWLKNTVEPFFGGDRVIVALYRTEFLNTESDRTELCKSIEDTLGSIHKEIKFFADGQGLPAEIRQMEPLSDESRRKRQKAILKYGLSLMGKKINRQLELGSIDMEKLKDNVKRVEKERKDVELAGKIMVENTVGAFYTDLKNQIYDAAEQYNEDAYNSIRERISSTKDVKGDAEKIPAYLETVWTNFGSNVKEKLAQEQAKIVARLEERMEEDCGKLVGMLELSGDAPELSVLTVGKTYMRFGDGGNEADTKSKMVSKGMLIASIALAFVNPVWGLSAFAGTQLYQKYKERDAEQLRSQILGSLYGDCNQVRQKAVKQIYSVIDVAKKESGDNVGKIYSEIMDSLMDSIYQMVGKLEEAKKRCGILQELALEKLPAMEAQLNG